MLNKVRSFFGGSPKNDKEVNNSSWCYRNRYARDSMERQETADDDRGSSNSSDNYLIEDTSPRLLRSKSDSNLTPSDEDSYMRMLSSFRSSLELHDAARSRSDPELAADNNDDDAAAVRDEVQENVIQAADNEVDDYEDQPPNYYSGVLRVIRTYDTTTNSMQLQDVSILNFQGNMHELNEIAPYWKKDCRTWLWKSQKLPDRLRKLKRAQLFN
ncbi:uncharacterized protein LOC106654006 isoform X1 [Trichogramma pretiosum]|uniref:uncharacterized protein LOC106654006 isoform X1 n=2 Tax=Trichogramma pretiosum TaxID=7493 RepID=UPI0006C9C91D|nr:uncharacterized protein LOC106654006 isoform X1 [Trichogramma pretiosum]